MTIHCEQIEPRLNALLDDRLPLESDRQVAEHLRQCPACRQLAGGYARMLAATDIEPGVPPLSADFAARVVAATPQPTRQLAAAAVGESKRSTVDGIAWTVLATAALLMLAAWPIQVWRSAGDNPRPPLVASQTAPGAGPITGTEMAAADQPLLEEVWLATGRGLATLPITVRRAAIGAEGEGFGSTLRPVATSVTTTLESLLQMLPDDPQPTIVPGGGTGLCAPAPPSAVV